MDIYQPQCFPSENGNRAVAHRAPPLYMERGPGRVFFILTDAVGKAAWVTERALVQLIGPSATEVEDHQPNRTADRRIGPESWTKHRSEEHTSELQSLMRISYDVFCLKKKKKNNKH